LLQNIFKSKVFKNFSYLTIGSIISQALLLVTVLRITKFLSPSEYGNYTFILSQGMLFHAISDLGIKSTTIRAIARDSENTNNYIVNGAILRLLTLLLFFIIYGTYNNFLGSLDNTGLSLVFIYGMVYSFFYLLEYVFLGYQKMLYPSIIKILHSSVWFLIIMFLPQSYFSVNSLLGIFLVISFFQVILLFVKVRKEQFLKGKVTNFIKGSKEMLLESWPYITLMFLNLPFSHFANNFLDINSSSEEIGFFNLSKKLLGPVEIIITFSLTALFPNISQMFVKDKDKFLDLVKKGVVAFVLGIGILSFIFSLFSKEAILLLFSEQYLSTIKVVQLQVWFTFFHGINHLIAIIFGASNFEKKLFHLSLINCIISTPMLFIGSYYGAIGLSYGFVISFAIFEIYVWMQLKKTLNIQFKDDLKIWSIIVILFSISFFLPFDTPISLKFIIALVFLSSLWFVFGKQIKSAIKK